MRKTLLICCLMAVLLAGFSLAAARGVVNNEQPKSLKAAGLMAPPPPVGYPVDDSVVIMEGFEDGVPPHSWGRWIENETSPYSTWYSWDWQSVSSSFWDRWSAEGRFCAVIDADIEPQDEWLISHKINLANFPNLSVSFYWMTNTYYGIDIDSFDFEVYVRVNDLADWELVWSDDDYVGPPVSYNRWIYSEVDLSPWAGAKNARIAFRYVGQDSAQVLLDGVMGHANTAELELAGDAEVIGSYCPEGIVPEAPLPVRATILDAGDQATVEIALANTGTGPATNVRGILTPKNQWAKQVHGTVNFGTIGAGNTGTGIAVIQSHWNTPCSEIVAYELLVMCDQGSWTFNVNFPLGDIKDTILPIEMFEAGIPSTWTVVDNYGGYTWMTNREYLNNWYAVVDGEGMDNKTGGYGDCATVHGFNFGTWDYASTELHTPAFSLAGVSGAYLTFDVAAKFSGCEYFAVDMSTDGGSSWFEKLYWDGASWWSRLPESEAGAGVFWNIKDRRVELDLSDSIGQANCTLRFYYQNDCGYWSYAQVDNVAVREYTCSNTFSETFDIARTKQLFPPAGWSVTDLSGSGVTWNESFWWWVNAPSYYGFYNPTIGQNGEAAGVDSDAAGSYGLTYDPLTGFSIIDTELISPPIDLTPPARDMVPVLRFKSTFIDFSYGIGGGPANNYGFPQKGWVYASMDDGATWTTVATFEEQHMGYQTLPLNRYTGYNVMLKFRYSDAPYGYAGYWFIDDVAIDFCNGCAQGNCLGVDCPASVSDDVIQVGDTVYFDAFGDTNCPDATLNFTWLIQTTAEGCVKVLTGPSAEWTFNEPGEYGWQLTVTAPECDIDCKKSGIIFVDNPFDMFIYDNEGRVNFFFNMYSGRYQFRIFDEDDPYHAGTYNGWGVLAECNVAPQDGEVYWCFYTYEGYGWFMQVVLDMTHHIYRGWIMLEDGYYVEFYDDSHRTP